MTKAVVLDIGGVLAYDVWEHLFFEDKGIAATYHLDRGQLEKVGKALWKIFAYRPVTNPGDCRKFEEEYWELFIKAFNIKESVVAFIDRTRDFIKPVEGMDSLLGKLKGQGVDLLICSDNNEFWFKLQMDNLGLRKFFPDNRKVILSCRVGVSKSDECGKMFQSVLKAAQCKPKDCIFVDDRKENVERALKYDMTGILFPHEAKCGAQYLEARLKKMGYIQ